MTPHIGASQSITGEDLLPPQGQGLLRVPLCGSQGGDEREGPGEQHHEGGEQQPDGEERQRHDRNLGRQTGVIAGAQSPGNPSSDSSCGSGPGAGAGPAPARVLLSHKWLGEATAATPSPGDLRPHLPTLSSGRPCESAKEWDGALSPGVKALCPDAHALRQPRSCAFWDVRVLAWH